MTEAQTHAEVALGILSTPRARGLERRDGSRRTWLASASPGIGYRFLIRALLLSTEANVTLRGEHGVHGDMLFLPVGSADDRLHGRLIALHAWLRAVGSLFPAANWVCKADDDTYIRLHDWQQTLKTIALSRPPARMPILHGWLNWMSWDAAARREYRFSHSFDPAARCPPSVEDKRCHGPFPFASGWLIVLSAHLARHVAGSAAVLAEAADTINVHRGGTPMFDDVWLGSVVHRFGPEVPTVFIGQEHGNVHNSINTIQRRNAVERLAQRAFPTTVVFHHRGADALHQLVKQKFTTPPRPQLQCTDTNGTSAWVAELARQYRAYFGRHAGARRRDAFCMLVDLT